MEAILNTAKPIVQELVENELKTLIGENINEIDGLEAKIDTKLGEVAGKIKSLIIDNINKLPFVPDSIKKGFIDQIPVDQLVTIINGFDLEKFKATILAIPTTGISDPAKLNQIRTTLTELPDKIKKMLTTHIESIFNGVASAAAPGPGVPPPPPGAPSVLPPAPGAPTAEPTITATAEPAITATAEPAITATAAVAEKSIEEGLSNMPNDDKKETIDKIMKMLEDTGILDEIKKRICTPLVEAEAKVVQAEVVEAQTTNNGNPIATASLAAGGSNKKHRRKTKKNIRRQKRTYTKFGRNF